MIRPCFIGHRVADYWTRSPHSAVRPDLPEKVGNETMARPGLEGREQIRFLGVLRLAVAGASLVADHGPPEDPFALSPARVLARAASLS